MIENGLTGRTERTNRRRFDAAQDAWDNMTPDDEAEGDPEDFIEPDDEDDTDHDAEWGGMDV